MTFNLIVYKIKENYPNEQIIYILSVTHNKKGDHTALMNISANGVIA